jgi:hypothetical protein
MRKANPPISSSKTMGGMSAVAMADAIIRVPPITIARPEPHRNTE